MDHRQQLRAALLPEPRVPLRKRLFRRSRVGARLPDPPSESLVVGLTTTGDRLVLARGGGAGAAEILRKQWPLAGYKAPGASDTPDPVSWEVPGLAELQSALQKALGGRDADGDGWIGEGTPQKRYVGSASRGYNLKLPDETMAKITRLLQPPRNMDEVDQDQQIGPIIVEHLRKHPDGLGHHWTTNDKMAETAAWAGNVGGLPVIVKARYAEDDMGAQNAAGNNFAGEDEITLKSGANVEVEDVLIRDGNQWRSVWPGAISKSMPVVLVGAEVTGPGHHEVIHFAGVETEIAKAKRLPVSPTRTLSAIKRARRTTTDLDASVDLLTRSVAKEIRRSYDTLASNSQMVSLFEAWARGDFTDWQAKLQRAASSINVSPRTLAAKLSDAHTAGMPGVSILTPGLDMDAMTPQSIRYASTRAGDLVVGVNRSVRDQIAGHVQSAVAGDISLPELQAQLKRTVKLDPRMSAAVDTHRRALVAKGASTKDANRMSREYADRLLDHRAETIARTEVMSAYNAGQRDYWEHALADTGMPAGTVYWEWHTHPDERTCRTCGPMNGVRTGLDMPFTIVKDDGSVVDLKFPPVHPNCRCTLTIRSDTPATLAEALHRSTR